ncbi:NAD(+) diphosphatase [Klugiella xanthotipulae]|uniref:NAD(+) diphosphatase n=1 Tax=Klugiella xanthotipulae TaxID=244735 RepID=A0A543HRT6_9MICO|nr:NAD(+) diphosphatase [Klugiella xanthotipulae]TQM61032.1 NAD+ diphosphatase [Klugiella xanthotipulae]
MSSVNQFRLPLAASVDDRDAATRENPVALAAALSSPETRFVVLVGAEAILLPSAGADRGSDAPRLALLTRDELPGEGDDFYLGRILESGRSTHVALRVLTNSPATRYPLGNLRALAHLLPARDAALLTQSLALANWHSRYRFSPSTGRATVVDQGGWMRRDPDSGEQFFPRTDPAVIVLVRDRDDRILLGSNVLWEAGRYSLLAGFVEAGESLEAAVLREVAEESGLRVVEPTYRASQPWPFPRSLMLGFTARLADDETPTNAVPDGQEIVDLMWVSRDEVRADLPSLRLPGKSSIARALIDEWLAEA